MTPIVQISKLPLQFRGRHSVANSKLWFVSFDITSLSEKLVVREFIKKTWFYTITYTPTELNKKILMHRIPKIKLLVNTSKSKLYFENLKTKSFNLNKLSELNITGYHKFWEYQPRPFVPGYRIYFFGFLRHKIYIFYSIIDRILFDVST